MPRGQCPEIESTAVPVRNSGPLGGRMRVLPCEAAPGGFVGEAEEGAGKERGARLSGPGMREEGGRQGWGLAILPAHLSYHTDAAHDGCGFGLSPTHSAQSGGDKDLPRQVLHAQVATPSIQHSELQGEEWGAHCPLPAPRLPSPWARHGPHLSPRCHGRFPEDRCSNNCLPSSGRT